ncbi:MAG: iron-sulfur cluster-binding protein [Alicyclobacillus herbarius]|uniref:LutB/LldF family L-lactate oxidation iron-sulfur protein n=1 Tax=Alicyclobacillus herbarius TaxID=122960 RepID=UPI0023552F5B|nr:LutB/LldF family L-lactate oxidation iron-sulfur protein [Alicyclobacillus herbarius]MCL6632168.1 iron-sulfur cluster-binding protein [Alicyclobacillus herbarius]
MSQTGIQARANTALHNPLLQKAVQFTTDRLRTRKANVTEAFGHWQEWRDRGRDIRAHTIAHLDYYLKQFADNVRKAGGHVHFAADATEAAQAIVSIAEAKQAKLVVKSKSMVSEEIHLNRHLEEAGVRVVETDLGEYIIQLAGETPSHIIIPSIHKTREQIRDLFTEAGGKNLTTDTKALTGFARQTLRKMFQTADIGITGCNFGIAESGTVVLFTNEGNADMVANLPRTHVVIMGMERILPTFADLEVFSHLLPKSATGQNVITYMSCFTGPARADEQDGARDLHVVILDNGRSRQLGDPDFQPILHCIRCGACLNVCPVYRQIGGHAYGSVYPGPVGAVLTPLLNPGPEYADLPYASSLCGACYEACPVQIPLHDMLVKLRQRNVREGYSKAGERGAFRAFRFVFANSRRYRAVIRGGRLGQVLLARGGGIDARIGPLRGWTEARRAPALAKRSFRERWPKLQQELAQGRLADTPTTGTPDARETAASKEGQP